MRWIGTHSVGRWSLIDRPKTVAVVVALVGSVGAAGAFAATAHRSGRALGAKQVLAIQSAAETQVIVLLRNQHLAVAAGRATIARRIALENSEQAPLRTQIAASGGHVRRVFRTVNAFAATVTASERRRLVANTAVAAVVPDALITLPAGHARRATAHRRTARAADVPPVTNSQICPADPSKPLLEPEALSIIHAANADPGVPSAQQFANGAGVTVGFVADGVDVNNPDFIRPDGSHVFADFQDFSGEGPNAPTWGAEAFGDASSIAAQGRQVYDLSNYVNAAHPLPPGCNVTVRGVAPGASLAGVRVFNALTGRAYFSTILEGLDWLVAVDHVAVLNESFGGTSIPSTDQNLIKRFDEAATAAGVTVIAASGDSGPENTIGSPADDPSVVSVGASTQLQMQAQTTMDGYQFATNGWANNNTSFFGSAGFTQAERTIDLVAPGDAGWILCTPNPAQYAACTDNNGNPTPVSIFGGTSESAPLAAGAAALVIQAYRDTHAGHTPSPALVKALLTSTADDLDIPSREQGAGELDALAAVQAARSLPGASPSVRSGAGLLAGPTQLDLAGAPGTAVGGDVTVTNVGAVTQTVNARVRALTTQLSEVKGDAFLDASGGPTFVDSFGIPNVYTKVTFTVPAGADRLDAAFAWPNRKAFVDMNLIDPSGRFSGYSSEFTNSNYGRVDVRQPVAGTWTAILFTYQRFPSVPVHYDFSTSRFDTVDSVTPSVFVLPPGASRTVHVGAAVPTAAGDYSRDLELAGSAGRQSVVPIVVRSLIPVAGGGAFGGSITGSSGGGNVPEQDTFAFDVPPGAPALTATVTLSQDPGTALTGFLVSPGGQTLAQQSAQTSANGDVSLELVRVRPAPGRWRLLLATSPPVGGTTTSASYSGRISLAPYGVSATGVPNNPRQTLAAGSPVTAQITLTNPGPNTLLAFVDPRLATRTSAALVPFRPATNLSLPLTAGVSASPRFMVPTQTDALFASATGSAPLTFNWGFADPSLGAYSTGATAAGWYFAPEVTPGFWIITPTLVGPFSGPPSGTASVGIVAHTRQFDAAVGSSTGDPELSAVLASPPAVRLLPVSPNSTATMQVTFTPSGSPGQVVRGDLFVDELQSRLGAANELGDVPYAYKVGS